MLLYLRAQGFIIFLPSLFMVIGGCAVVDRTAADAEQAYPRLFTRLVSYTVSVEGKDLVVPGILRIPKGAANKVPAVIILHGSAGIDSRGASHSLALNREGIATLEIDMWSARGIEGGTTGRPAAVHETLPDVWGAAAFLSQDARIDRNQIGVLGFSWGGVLAILTATTQFGTPPLRHLPTIAAQVAFYPVCWAYNRVPNYEFRDLRRAPLLIVVGTRDGYDDGADPCLALVSQLPESQRNRVSVKTYTGALHGFDMLESAYIYEDRYAHRGQGGETMSAPRPRARKDVKREVVRFFQSAFNPKTSLQRK